MTPRRDDRTYTVHPGQWLVLIPQQDGAATVLSVESSEQDALAWRTELVRRIIATPDCGQHVLTTADGRVLWSGIVPSALAGLQRGASVYGPRELLVVRVETPLPPMRRVEAKMHELLPGRFPA